MCVFGRGGGGHLEGRRAGEKNFLGFFCGLCRNFLREVGERYHLQGGPAGEKNILRTFRGSCQKFLVDSG